MARILLFSVIMMVFGGAFAQDTIRLMHYNLLNYRNTTNQCTNSTNNPDKKDGFLSQIVSFVQPDILTINEMGANWLNPNKLLTNALNKGGVSHFEQAEFANNSFSSLTNMLFFNNKKLDIYSQDAISKDLNNGDLVRVIDVYTLFVKNGGLSTGDTTFLTVFVAHLKAGSNSSDKEQRAKMTEAAMDYLDKNHVAHNYFFAGDFNIQTHSEQCYQILTKNSNATIRFYDPKEAPGSWNNSSTYSNLHTQSTHDGDSRGGCFSLGGMDDRFDFILCGKEVLDNTYGVKYVDDSYLALGQDSRRFNGNIKLPTSNIIPASVSNALYEMSDHLPVIMEVSVKDPTVSADEISKTHKPFVRYLSDGSIEVDLPIHLKVTQIALRDVLGKDVSNELVVLDNKITLNSELLASGIYYVQVLLENNEIITNKISVE